MTVVKRSGWLIAGLLILALTLAACSNAQNAPPLDDPVDNPEEGAAATTVSVELNTYEIVMPDTLPPGNIRFEITNISDSDEHGFEFVGPDVEAVLPGPLQPGETAYLTVQVQAGETYVAYCPVDDHDDMGMQMNVRVLGEP